MKRKTLSLLTAAGCWSSLTKQDPAVDKRQGLEPQAEFSGFMAAQSKSQSRVRTKPSLVQLCFSHRPTVPGTAWTLSTTDKPKCLCPCRVWLSRYNVQADLRELLGLFTIKCWSQTLCCPFPSRLQAWPFNEHLNAERWCGHQGLERSINMADGGDLC